MSAMAIFQQLANLQHAFVPEAQRKWLVFRVLGRLHTIVTWTMKTTSSTIKAALTRC